MLGAVVPKAWGTSVWGDFNKFGTRNNAAAYARDIGGILGSGTFHTGRGLGFAGFDAGFHLAYQFSPGGGNDVLEKSGIRRFGMPWFQAEIGLPLKFDGFIRGFSWQGLTIAGGGLRYALLTIQDQKGVPQVLLTFDGESFSHHDFGGSHFGLNAVASLKFDYARPYIGGGLDRTRLVAKRSISDPTIIDDEFIKYGYRMVLGVSLRPVPFSYLTAALALRHGEPGAQIGAGVRF